MPNDPAQSGIDVPAAAGGAPVKQTPFGGRKRYGEEELQQLREALEQGSLFYAYGTKVRALEEQIARRAGVRFAVAASSGTAGIHTALMAAGISPGDEVITSPITDMGTVIPILFQGAVPVFADVDPHSYVMSPGSVEACVTEKTRAVLAVHLWGNACDLKALREICHRHGLVLIEDCAQACGSVYEGRSVGVWGDVGCFSLNEFKHISCGDGGVVVSDDEALGKRLRLASDKCYDRTPDHADRSATFLANNYRMTELQGAVAVAQLRHLDDIVARRRAWCEALTERLAGVPGISLPRPTVGCDPSWWLYIMRVQPDVLGVDADGFAEAVRAEGVPVSAHYIGRCVYEYPIFVDHSAFERGSHPFSSRHYAKGLCPTAESVLDTCVVLGINEGYTQSDLDETARAITRVARWFARRD